MHSSRFVSLILQSFAIVGLLSFVLRPVEHAAAESNNLVFIPYAKRAGPPLTPIAYSEGFQYSQKYLKTILADNSQQKQILELPPYAIYSPAWSPDGKRLALSIGGSFIYIMNADGSGLTKIVDLGPSYTAISPAWSPDGKSIAFASSYGGGSPPRQQTYLFSVQADGTKLRQLTRSTRKDIPWHDVAPSWSPDGTLIVFQRLIGEDSSRLYRLDLASGQAKELPGPAGCLSHASWSPDGQLLAFAVGCSPVTGQNVFTMRPDGSNITQRTFKGEGGSPSWSPDGQWIVLTDSVYVSILELSTGQISQLQLKQGTHADPAWAPYQK